MIDELINGGYVDVFERPKRLRNLSFPIQFDERLLLARAAFWCRKDSELERLIPGHPVVHLPEHLAQNRPLGFAEDAVPEIAVTFKVILRVAGASYFRFASSEAASNVSLTYLEFCKSSIVYVVCALTNNPQLGVGSSCHRVNFCHVSTLALNS